MNFQKYKNNFVRSRQIGEIAEKNIKNILDKIGQCSYNGDCRHDISVSGPLNFTIEVKHDLYSNRSGNIAVEYHNCKKDKPSGIMSSEADFWVFYLNPDEIYLITLANLKRFVENNTPHKNIIAGGDKNANIYLYKKLDILSEFTNLSDLGEEETRRIFQQYCNQS